jgi:hypothetical protein
VAEEDEQDEAVPEGCSPEHMWRWRGDVPMVKNVRGSSLVQEQRKMRESSVVRGNGAGCYGEWSLPFIGVGEAVTGSNDRSNGLNNIDSRGG